MRYLFLDMVSSLKRDITFLLLPAVSPFEDAVLLFARLFLFAVQNDPLTNIILTGVYQT